MDRSQQQQPAPIRVVIVDDHDLFRNSLSLLLDGRPRLHVVGTAATAAHGIDLAAFEDADVVVMDIRLPGMDGVEATRRLLSLRPQTKVVAVSAADDEHEEADALGAGAVWFLRKDKVSEAIVDVILASVTGDQPQ